MRKLIPMTMVALFAFAAPAFAQDGGIPGLEGLQERVEKLMKKVDDVIQPLLRKLEETLDKLVQEFQGWVEELDPKEMFGEFDLEGWIERLREMMPPMPEKDDDGREDFMSVPAPPLIC